MSYSGIDLSLFGKYPFDIDEKLTVFPLLGATYRATGTMKIDGDDIGLDAADYYTL